MNFQRIKIYLLIVFVSFSIRAFSQDQQTADSLISLLNSAEMNDSVRKDVLYNIAYSHTNPDTIIGYCEKLIALALKTSDYTYAFRGHYLKGDALRQLGKHKSALDNFFQSANYAVKCDYKKGLGVVYSAIGALYSSSNNCQNSIFYYDKAINILQETNDSMSLASVMLNLGTNYFNSGKYDSALHYFELSEKIFVQKKYTVGIAYCLGNKAFIETKQHKYAIAEKHLLDAIDILTEYNDIYSITSYYSNLANIYRRQDKLQLAREYAKKALDISLKNDLKAQVRDAYEQLAEIESASGNYPDAFRYQSKYYTYRDSINNSETIQKMADLRTEYEVSQKQTEIDALIKAKKTRTIIAFGLILALVLTLIFASIIYYQLKRNKQLSKLLISRKAELQKQHDQLEEINKTKDKLFSIISHDLRGPIGVLNGTTLLIREYLESKDYKQLNDLTSNMEYSVKKVQHLLDNLLEWAINQQGKFSFSPEKLELNDLIKGVISIFDGMAAAKNIKIHYQCKHDSFFINADRNSLMTILRNLLSNAIKFTDRNGSIKVQAYKYDKDIVIKVSDTGIGMSGQKIISLFRVGENESTWGTEREKGLGLGLVLVHEFVKMIQGTIEVESEVGVGSTFTIKFPSQVLLTTEFLHQDIKSLKL